MIGVCFFVVNIVIWCVFLWVIWYVCFVGFLDGCVSWSYCCTWWVFLGWSCFSLSFIIVAKFQLLKQLMKLSWALIGYISFLKAESLFDWVYLLTLFSIWVETLKGKIEKTKKCIALGIHITGTCQPNLCLFSPVTTITMSNYIFYTCEKY